MRSINDRLMPVFILLGFGAVMLLQVGVDLGKKDLLQAGIEFLWAGLMWWFAYITAKITISDRIEELKDSVDGLEARLKSSRENGVGDGSAPERSLGETPFGEVLKDVIENLPNLQAQHDQALDEKLVPIMKDVFPQDKMPTPEQINEVKKRFTEETGHYVKITIESIGEVSTEYFETPIEEDEPKGAKKPGKKIPVVDESKEVIVDTSGNKTTPPKRPLGNKKK